MATTAAFMQQLTGCQSQLYAYICSLLGGSVAAPAVLQETNVVLWEKAGEYDPGRPFLPWAFAFAYIQVLAHRKKQSRDRLVFDEDLVRRISDEVHRREAGSVLPIEALDDCLSKLSPEHRALIDLRYIQAEPVRSIAARLKKGPNVVAALLYRIRKVLLDCVQSSVATGGDA